MFGLVVPPATFADPSPKLQLNEYGAVPPEAEAVKLTGVPTLPVVGAEVKITVTGVPGLITIVAVAGPARAALPSVTLTLTVNVPLVLYVWDIVFGLAEPPETFTGESPKLQLNV